MNSCNILSHELIIFLHKKGTFYQVKIAKGLTTPLHPSNSSQNSFYSLNIIFLDTYKFVVLLAQPSQTSPSCPMSHLLIGFSNLVIN